MPTRIPNFNFLALIVSEIKRVSQNLMWALLRRCHTLKLLRVLQVLGKVKQLPNFSIVSLCIMLLCEYVFPIGFPLYVPKNGVFGGFEGEDVKMLSSDHQKALPCVNTRLLMYRVSKSVRRPEL